MLKNIINALDNGEYAIDFPFITKKCLTLNWHARCEYICGKMSKGISSIIKGRKVFNETTLLSVL